MSGYDQIIDWSDDEIPMADYDDFLDWWSDMQKNFDDNGRIPIDDIFDADDLSRAESRFNDIHAGDLIVEKNIREYQVPIDEAIKEIKADIPEFVKPDPVKTIEKNYTVKEIARFFKRIFFGK